MFSMDGSSSFFVVGPRRHCSAKALLVYLTILTTSFGALPAHSHDFWIEPATFRPAVGEKIPLRLFVGEHFKGEPLIYAPTQFERYIYAAPSATHAVTGAVGDDPAGSVAVNEPGTYVVGYYSKKSEVTFESYDKFEEYLIKEGLEQHRTLAKKRAQIRDGVLESFTRCVKVLMHTPAASKSQGVTDRVLGFPLELIAEALPEINQPNARLRLLYQGQPLEGALVVAFTKQQPLTKIKARTDKAGRVTLPLSSGGVWLVTTVHMIPASLLGRADWESYWASLSFAL
jgi:uncharacterized GH25 family protein